MQNVFNESAGLNRTRVKLSRTRLYTMITDVQLAIFTNVLGVALFLFVVLYHYIGVNNVKKSD